MSLNIPLSLLKTSFSLILSTSHQCLSLDVKCEQKLLTSVSLSHPREIPFNSGKQANAELKFNFV